MYKAGRIKTGGRKPGVPNRNTQAVKDALKAALEASDDDGAEGYFLKISRDDPKTFMAAVGKLIPTAIESKHEVTNTVTVRKYSGGREREREKKSAKGNKKTDGSRA